MTEISYYDDTTNAQTSGTTSITPDGVAKAFCQGCDHRKTDGGCNTMSRERQLITAAGGFCASAQVRGEPVYMWLRRRSGGGLEGAYGKKS